MLKPTIYPESLGLVRSDASPEAIGALFQLGSTELLKETQEAVVLTDQHLNIMEWNSAASQIYGWCREELLGKHLGEFLPTRYHDFETPFSLENLMEVGNWEGEVFQKSKNRQRLHIKSKVKVLTNQTGQFVGLILINRLIEKEADILQGLQHFKKELPMVTQNIPLGYIRWNHALRVEGISLQTSKLTGWQFNDLRDNDLYHLPILSISDQEAFDQAMIQAVASGNNYFNVELNMNTRGGSYIACRWYNTILKNKDGKMDSLITYIEDRSDIEISEKKIASIAEAAPGILFQCVLQNESHDFTYISNASPQCHNRGEIAIDGQEEFLQIMEKMSPEDAERMNQKIQDARNCLSICEFEFSVVLQQKNRWFRIVSSPSQHANGGVTYTGFMTDITRYKKVNEDLEKRNFELSNFAYKVSHDFRAPLCSVKGLLDLMKKEKDPAFFFRYIELIEASVDRLDHFILNVLGHIKVTSRKLEHQDINLQDLITETYEELAYIPFTNRIQKDIRLFDPIVHTDKLLLKEILKSLISNGIKYQDRKKEESFIRLSAKEDDDHLFLEYQDNGLGIGEKHHEKLFDMFYRASESSQGSGIGLYILKQAVDKLHGRVEVKSQVNMGTTFSIILPRQ